MSENRPQVPARPTPSDAEVVGWLTLVGSEAARRFAEKDAEIARLRAQVAALEQALTTRPTPAPVAASAPLTISIYEAMRFAGLSRTTLYRLTLAGHIQSVRHGRRTLIVMASLRRYFDALSQAKSTGTERK